MHDDPDDRYCQFIAENEPPKPTSVRTWAVHMSHQGLGATRGATEGFICCGWVEAGNLRDLGEDGIESAFRKHYPEAGARTISQWVGDARRFAFEMNPGELFVYLIEGGGDAMIGVVAGVYEFRGDDPELVAADSANVRRVKWLLTVPRAEFAAATLRSLNSRHTVHEADQHRAEAEQILRKHGVAFNAQG